MPHTCPPRSGRARRALGGAVLALVLGVVVVGTPASAPAQEEDPGPIDADALRAEYEELAGEEAQLLVDYDLSTARLEQLTLDVFAAEQAADEADRALADAETDLATRREEEAEAEQELEEARDRVAAAEDQVRLFAVESYIGEGAATDIAEVLELLDGDDGSLVRRGYRRSVDRKQGEVIDQLIDARTEQARLQEEAEDATERAQRQRDDVEALREAAAAALAETTRLAQEAAAERDRQGALILDIQARRVSIEARIVNLDRAADGVEAVLASFQAEDPDWIPGSLWFQSPVPCTEISSEFGQRAHPILNITRLHAGVDIGAATGDPVEAAADGIVLLAEPRGGYGNTVVIAHLNSLGTVYAHNSELLVQTGQQVKRGDVIARAGSTGLSTGPHVHFETRLKGVPVNPRNFLLPVEGGTGQPGPEPPEQPDRPDLATTTTTTEPIGDC
ncbi:MAG TPA: M23 family metallopeptidase [Iamia sp.]|nr:M23 family metallopeptidase [Iamia sp.]